MRIIAIKTLKHYFDIYPEAEGNLLAWVDEIEEADWSSPHELKEMFRSASILSNKRVVFNIHGNKYRLIVDIEFRFRIVFVAWFGTHAEYDKIDAKKIKYVKAD